MSQRYEAVAVRRYEKDGEEKAAFTNIGVAWPMKDRDGYTVRLHAFPVPEDGEFVILLMPPKERDDQRQERGPARRDDRPSDRSRQQPQRNSSPPPSFSRDMDDDIPF
jgi:hypothetical protein